MASLSLNIFWIFWVIVHRPAPTVFTDGWVSLHKLPLVSKDALPDPNTPQHSGNVVATSLYTDEFAAAIATLGHSLNRVNTTARRLMLYIPEQVSPRGLCIATASGFEPKPVQRIAPPNDGRDVYKHFVDQYTKLRLWELDQEGASQVVYLDADTLVVRNFDELFALPYNLGAVPDVYTNRKGFALQFNAGVLFLRPSTAVFRTILEKMPTAHYWHHEAEQALLNTFFAKEVARLPYAYNANLAIKARSPRMWEGIKDEIRVIHYTMAKPFTGDEWRYVSMDKLEENARRRGRRESGRFAEEMEMWAQAWKETYATYGQKLKGCMMLSDERGH
ncbi:nucleotide-diphospho-sugar transferase [Lentinus brumalis]|uniref:Nucleotide-diphospho-sugar transferase n=1 Tax=Lentinus brumalis TaxID=2498619 RepID=A0A371DNM8_9APHY|nr:nucleotide-diphospho-sugar transferase [Polyporus brumalis]